MFVKICTLLLCTALSISNVAASTALCSDKNIPEQGSTSFPYPDDCSKYVTCTNYETDGFIVSGYTMDCSFPTYWNDELKTCDHVTKDICPNDYCQNMPDGTLRAGNNNCRGYWECGAGKSKHECCVVGQMFINASVGCQDVPPDVNCTDNCDSDVIVNVTQVNVTDSAIECNKTAVPDDPQKYQQYVEGHGVMTLPCGAGTFFNATSCLCDHDSGSTAKQPCKADLYVPFDTDTEDQSDVHVKVINHHVEVINGSGEFDGVMSELIISRYNNLGQASTFILNMIYESDHVSLNTQQTVVANDHCENSLPSVIIKEDNTTVYFTVGLDGGASESVQIAQPASKQKTITFELNNGLFTGTVNGDSTSVNATGYLENTPCALTVGSSKANDFFAGSIADMSIYLCDPQST